ncbi:hypothetical protein [Heliophilum fasciatum]|uniref:Uncharacterized protein n=1 Tax=Heliophilum fasciatum TaxID=35700 RepID=A0A4R2RLR5_9FIRM|nr:hypothetical protein [Heliophilum fasciatum]MCW2278449.1 hypothetical protein [Heliophilum fasciatum]TCP63579.1 hypothetical protein EDD73_1174 [Heliophilum fasciatum]
MARKKQRWPWWLCRWLTIGLLLWSGSIGWAATAIFPGDRADSLTKALVLPVTPSSIYGRLTPEHPIDYFKFPVQRGEELRLSMLIPRDAGDEVASPSVAVMGPGLALPEDVPEQISLPAGAGLHIVQPANKVRPVQDQANKMDLDLTQVFQLTAPADAEYTIAIYDQNRRPGVYILQIGSEPEATWSSVLMHPLRALEVQAWRQPLQVLLPLALVLMALLVIVGGRRKK